MPNEIVFYCPEGFIYKRLFTMLSAQWNFGHVVRQNIVIFIWMIGLFQICFMLVFRVYFPCQYSNIHINVSIGLIAISQGVIVGLGLGHSSVLMGILFGEKDLVVTFSLSYSIR